MAIRFGLLLPHEEGPGLAPVTWASIRDRALQAEGMGLSSVWLVDHFLWRGDPWGRDLAMGIPEVPYGVTECWTTLAAVAAATERVDIGTVVTCTAYRNPAMLAKMADTVDMISGGRLILGLGAGDYPPEHEMIGVPAGDRPFARFEEALAIILPLLKEGHVDFEGEFYQARDMRLQPRGPRPKGPPIMIGSLAQGPRSLRLVAQNADIWNTWMEAFSPAELQDVHDRVDAGCVKHGRDPATLKRYLGVSIQFEGPDLGWPGMLTGSEEEIAESLGSIASGPVDEIQAILLPTTGATVEALGRIIEMVEAS